MYFNKPYKDENFFIFIFQSKRPHTSDDKRNNNYKQKINYNRYKHFV